MSETDRRVLDVVEHAQARMCRQPATAVEMKIADDGEMLARGGNNFVGYLGQPEKTAETIDADGWVHTGDIGEIDDDGYLGSSTGRRN